jgi:hypothetical protein
VADTVEAPLSTTLLWADISFLQESHSLYNRNGYRKLGACSDVEGMTMGLRQVFELHVAEPEQALWNTQQPHSSKRLFDTSSFFSPQPSQSRVLRVNAPKEIMKFEHWNAYFRQWSVLQWDGHDIIFEDENRRIMEFRFLRIDGQAQMCLQAIDADETIDKTTTWAYYGHDPYNVENAL